MTPAAERPHEKLLRDIEETVRRECDADKTASNGHGVVAEARPLAPRPDRAAITAHLTQLHDLAKAYNVPGKLILTSFGEDPSTGTALPSKIEHFAVGDVKSMVERAMVWTIEVHRNVYAPWVLMRLDLPAGKKGGESDIVVVLALVGDFDDEDARNWKRRSLIPPSFVVETSPGRYQTFCFLDPTTPVSLAEAKALAIRMQEYARSDFGSRDVSHVWRVAWTLSWPNKKKADAGRSRTPHLVRVVPGGTGQPIDPSALSAVLAPVPLVPVTRTPVLNDPHRGAALARKTRLTPPDPIPETLKADLEGRSEETDRSKLFFKVVNLLDRLGYADTTIAEMLATNAFVTPERYHDRMLIEVRACLVKGTTPWISAFNQRFGEVIDRGQSVFVTEGLDARTGTKETYVLSVPQLRDRFTGEPIPKNDKGKPIADNMADVWRRDPHHRCHEDGFVTKPDGPAPATAYNLWQGYGTPPDPTADDALILRFLREVICQGLAALYEKLLCLLAYLVQKPGEPWTVALILAGGQGTGKTTLAMIFKRIYGAHYRTEDTLEDLFVTFNSGLLSKIVISVEEGASGGRADVWARLKPFLTRPDLSINEKYRPAITVPNTSHLFISTNKLERFRVDHDDRRFWILTVKDAWTKAQFKALYACIADGRPCGRFLYRLQHHPIGDFDPQRDRPLTAALAESKERSFTPDECIVRSWLEDARLGSFGDFEPDGLLISRKSTCAAYEAEMQRSYRGQKPLGRNSWYGRLRDMLVGAISEPTKQPDQERQFHIAPIGEARIAFNRYVKQELQWDDPAAVSPPASQLPQRGRGSF